ncbi:MAG TPA: hypothetical protein VKO45_08240 [Methanomicrobiales archaeon]|nr:hypothetical protein [Methanomicrobiales archaeon]
MANLEKLTDGELRALMRSRYHFLGSYMMTRVREWDICRDDSVDWMIRKGGDVL